MGKGQMVKVALATPAGEVEVDGEVYGFWAVTPRVNGRCDGSLDDAWAITHVPTGRSYGGVAFVDKGALRRFVQWVGREFTDPAWAESDPERLVAGLPEGGGVRFTAAFWDFRNGEFNP